MTTEPNLIDSNKNPLALFEEWYEEAKKNEINDPNAMNLATISADGKPSSRIVLLKSFNEQGFIFYTNSNSKKGKSIESNINVALNFHWKSLQKQIQNMSLICYIVSNILYGSVTQVLHKHFKRIIQSVGIENTRPGGGIGRRKGLIIPRQQSRAGSTPALGK